MKWVRADCPGSEGFPGVELRRNTMLSYWSSPAYATGLAETIVAAMIEKAPALEALEREGCTNSLLTSRSRIGTRTRLREIGCARWAGTPLEALDETSLGIGLRQVQRRCESSRLSRSVCQ